MLGGMFLTILLTKVSISDALLTLDRNYKTVVQARKQATDFLSRGIGKEVRRRRKLRFTLMWIR